MSTLLKPTLSRWGRSVYETASDIDLESRVLSEHLTVLPEYADAEIVVLHSKQRFGAAELKGLLDVRLVVTTTSGWEHMDVPWLKSQGIRCARMPMIRRDAVVESTLGMLLHHNRRQQRFMADAAQGIWSRGALHEILPYRIQDQRIAIIGLGVIGKRLAEVIHLLGGHVLGCDPYVDVTEIPHVTPVEWQEIPAVADVVLCACSHNDETDRMVDTEWLNQCQGLVFINCARGKLIDFNAVMGALREGHLGFVGLDVFPEEPFSHLDLVLNHPNLVFTPHAAGYHPKLAMQIRTGLQHLCQNWIESQSVPFEL